MKTFTGLVMLTLSRRSFLRILSAIGALGFVFPKHLFARRLTLWDRNATASNIEDRKDNLGVSSDGLSHIYVSRNGSPENNMAKVIEMMGGLERIIGARDVVLLKPNAQWWAQGMTNTNAMKEFIHQVLDIKGFEGEVIIAENHHFPQDNSRGWTTQHRNGDFNYNELIEYFHECGHRNVTKYHWHDGGPSEPNLWGGAENGGLVTGPKDGDGYVWCYDLVYKQLNGRKALMNYPIFTSSYSGLTIDFRYGIWREGVYLNDRHLRFINFAGLNHHGGYTGITSSIKNYLGVVDLTCGYRGKEPKGYSNFHNIGGMNIHWRLRELLRKLGCRHPSQHVSGAVAMFMRTIRMADLNIITAEDVGYGSRIDPTLKSRERSILASTDPVALDYYGAKHILLPATKKAVNGHKFLKTNDPDNQRGPLCKFVRVCNQMGIGNLNRSKMRIELFDFNI